MNRPLTEDGEPGPEIRSTSRNPVVWMLVAPIHLYQRVISPAMPPRCRYAPSCSAYAVEALHVHGLVKGLILATWRLLRCNPWSHGGVDRVPPRGRWRPDQWIPPEDWAGNLDLPEPVPMGLEDDSAHDFAASLSGRSTVRDVGVLDDDADLPASTGRPMGASRVPTI